MRKLTDRLSNLPSVLLEVVKSGLEAMQLGPRAHALNHLTLYYLSMTERGKLPCKDHIVNILNAAGYTCSLFYVVVLLFLPS